MVEKIWLRHGETWIEKYLDMVENMGENKVGNMIKNINKIIQDFY